MFKILALATCLGLAAASSALAGQIAVGPDVNQSWDLGKAFGTLTLAGSSFDTTAILNGSVPGTIHFGNTIITAGPVSSGVYPVKGETPVWTFSAAFSDGSAVSGTIKVAEIDDGTNPKMVGTFTVTSSTGALAPASIVFGPPLQFTGTFETPGTPLSANFFDIRDSLLSALFTWSSSRPNCTPITVCAETGKPPTP